MKRNTSNNRKAMYDFGQDRYNDLLREAEQFRFEQRAMRTSASANNKVARQSRSPITHLLFWAKTRIAS